MADNSNFIIANDENASFQVFETNLTTGEFKELIRTINFATGAVTYKDAATGVDANPAGTVARSPVRVTTGRQSVAVSDTGVTSLSPPSFSQIAEVHVHDAAIIYTTDGTNPDQATRVGKRVNDGGFFEIEGNFEVFDFKAIALSGQPNDAVLSIEFKNGETMTYASAN